jgi:hypothetical protein
MPALPADRFTKINFGTAVRLLFSMNGYPELIASVEKIIYGDGKLFVAVFYIVRFPFVGARTHLQICPA